MLDVAAVFVLGSAAAYLPLRWSLDRIFPARRTQDASASPVPSDLFDWITTSDDWLVLDIETTSLRRSGEVIEIAVVSANGQVLLDQLVLPKGKLTDQSNNVHGIERKMLRGQPTWPEVIAIVEALTRGRPVISYSAEFRQRMMNQSSDKWGCGRISVDWHCAMLAYARHRGIQHRWRPGEWTWHKLADAIEHEAIGHEQRYRAAPDALLVRNLVLKIARDRQIARSRRKPAA